MEVIDVHCHVYPDKIAIKAAQSVGKFYGAPMGCDGTMNTLLQESRSAGISRHLIHSVATKPMQVKSINEFICATVNGNPDLFFGYGTLHPDSTDMEGDINHLIDLNLHGVKIHPDIQGFKLDDYRALKIYELCEKYSLPLLIHTGDSRFDMSNPNRLVPILKIYDKLTVIGAHFGGYSMWEEASKMCAGIPNLYVDCSSSLYFLSKDKAVEIIRRYGADRVFFGTDYPMWRMKEELQRFLALPLTDEEREMILYKNAKRVLGMP